MTRLDTEHLIERLASDGSAVRRLRSPLLRAAIWLGGFAVAAAIIAWIMGPIPGMAMRLSEPRFALELFGTLMTGVLAVGAAFYLSLPDRSRLWLFAPLPALVLWLSTSGYGCYRDLVVHGSAGWTFGPSANCFAFILGMGIPAAVALYLPLRRAAPLDPVPVLAIGGLGVAALVAGALQFFHPFDVTLTDLSVHLAAILLVVSGMALLGRLGSAHATASTR